MQKVFKNKGSITVFLTMVLVICMSAILALLEVARVSGLQTQAELVSDVTIESMFAEYQKNIYENYGILLLDESYQTGIFNQKNLETEYVKINQKNCLSDNMYQLKLEECSVEACRYVTDYGGEPFRRLVLQKQAGLLLENSDLEFREKAKEYSSMQEKNLDIEKIIKSDYSACKEYKEEKTLIDVAAEWTGKAILSTVIRDETSLSEKAINTENNLEHRLKNQENVSGGYENNFFQDKIVFTNYLQENMGCYTNINKEHVLDYELEYIFSGKASDKENLGEVIKSLILIRELSNMTYLLSDSEKCVQAQAAAVAIAGWTKLPSLIELTKVGILSAWAYNESILDIRALLEGKKVSFLKTTAEWNLNMIPTITALDGFLTAKECENGWGYITYLKFLLYLKNEQEVNYRSMDIIEANTNKTNEMPIKMDHMAVYLKIKSIYESEPVFWKYISLKTTPIKIFELKKIKEYSYL